jgi:hypothetical protein
LQLLEHGDDIGRPAVLHQGRHGAVDQAVFVAVEVAVRQQLGRTVPGQVVQQQATQHALLGLHAVRRHTQARHLVVTGVGLAGIEDR